MKITINETQFISAFADMNRSENFTYKGRQALFNGLKSMSNQQAKKWNLM